MPVTSDEPTICDDSDGVVIASDSGAVFAEIQPTKIVAIETLLAQLNGLIEQWRREYVVCGEDLGGPEAMVYKSCAEQLREVLSGHE